MAPEGSEDYFEEEHDQADAAGSSQHERLLQCKLYRLLLEKYAGLINERERKTIGEIKALVNADDLTIQSILSDFKGQSYRFPQNYLPAAGKALQFVQREISYVKPDLNLNYWLSAKEIFSSKVGDDEDLAVFLCSLLFGLGDEEVAVIIAELDSLRTHAFVATDFQKRFFILDPSQKHTFDQFSGAREQALKSFAFRGAKIKRFLYKFNSSTYEQFM